MGEEEEVVLDFSNIKPDEGTVVPRGWYDVEVVKVKLMHSKPKEGVPNSGGMRYLNFETKIVDGEYENRRLFYRAAMGSKKSKDANLFVMGRLMALCHSFGIKEEQVRFIADKQEDNLLIEPEFTGMVAKALVKHRTYEGELREDVQRLVGYGANSKGTPAEQNGSENGSLLEAEDDTETEPVAPKPAPKLAGASAKPTFK